MTIFDFAKSISQIIHVECRPNGDVIASFGKDCQLIIDNGTNRSYFNAIHGRGKTIEDAIASLTMRLIKSDERCKLYLKFMPEFDKQVKYEITQEISL